MNDTDPVVKKIYHDMLMKKTNEERMIMGFSMYESAKQIASSSIKDKNNLKVELFKRFYKNDFNEENQRKIIESIEEYEKEIK